MNFTRRICWILFSGAAFGQQTVSLSGVVLDAGSRAPLSGVHVQLVPVIESPTPFGTTTGNDGRFSFTGIPAGSYAVVPRFPGMVFEPLDPAGPIVPDATLVSGETKEIQIGMAHKAVISGRVTDEARVPVENVSIQIESAPGRQAALRFYQQYYQLSTQIRTDDRGEYRISVPPGAYYVRANVMILERTIGASAASAGVYVDTYFPSTPKATQPIEAQAGRESAHTDIVLLEKHSLTISGVVSGIQLPGWTSVMANSPAIRVFRFTPVDSSGRFTIRNLPPETYIVYAENTVEADQHIRRHSAAVEIKLTDRDVTDLALTVGEVVHLTGHIETAAGAPVTAIHLVPALPGVNIPPVEGVVNAKGDFEIDRVNAERYKISLTSDSHNVFVRSVTLSGNSSPDRTLDLRHVGAATKAVISCGVGARVSGTVSATGGPLALRGMVVILDPLDKNIPAERTRAGLNNQGSYTFEAIPPGRYRLALMTGRPAALPLASEEIDAALARAGETIEVTGTAEVKKDLKADEPPKARERTVQ